MRRVKNFDRAKYKEVLERFGNCRRGVKSYEIWELLEDLQPGDPISERTINLLDKWIATNPSGSYGNCAKAAQEIKSILLD